MDSPQSTQIVMHYWYCPLLAILNHKTKMLVVAWIWTYVDGLKLRLRQRSWLREAGARRGRGRGEVRKLSPAELSQRPEWHETRPEQQNMKKLKTFN